MGNAKAKPRNPTTRDAKAFQEITPLLPGLTKFSLRIYEKYSAKYRKKSAYLWFRKEICYNQTKLKTPKIVLSSKLPLKNLKKVRKYFRAPFLSLLVKIGGLTATTFPRPKVDHAHLLRTLLNSKTYGIVSFNWLLLGKN